jgi:hypothetical protein
MVRIYLWRRIVLVAASKTWLHQALDSRSPNGVTMLEQSDGIDARQLDLSEFIPFRCRHL